MQIYDSNCIVWCLTGCIVCSWQEKVVQALFQAHEKQESNFPSLVSFLNSLPETEVKGDPVPVLQGLSYSPCVPLPPPLSPPSFVISSLCGTPIALQLALTSFFLLPSLTAPFIHCPPPYPPTTEAAVVGNHLRFYIKIMKRINLWDASISLMTR